jgi:uncharacterized protein
MNFIVAEKEGPHGMLLIITDSNIIDKSFEEGKFQLDLTKKFYKGEKKGKEEVKKMIEGAQHIHLTGKAAVAIGIEMDLIDSDKILYVDGIPHAEMVSGE